MLTMTAPVICAALVMAADPVAGLTDWFTRIGLKQLDAREAEIRQIKTRADAEARRARVRAKLLDVLGGSIPAPGGPLNAKVHGTTIDAGAYRIEKVTYDSLPGMVVTANLYVPKSGGKHPAVLFSMGHWDRGKSYAQRIAGNLAAKGFVVLAYDPIGQGERQQAYDALLGNSLIGGSVAQHMQNGALSLLLGEGVMRYFVADGRRGVDYLVSRPEVDAERIGATGCSGGGTVTTFVSALEPRIKVAAPACYMQTFRVLLPGSLGDSEQSAPRFVSEGLDQADLVELFSPKPWLISSTEKDFFTPAGAKPVFEEARNWYELYGAQDRIKWVVGPGEHGTPLEVREAIYDWMLRWLGKDLTANAKEQDVMLFADHQLWVTPRGQLSETVNLNTVIAQRMMAMETRADLGSYLKREILKAEPYPELVTKFVPLPPDVKPSGRGMVLVQRYWEMEKKAKDLAAAGDAVLIVSPRGLPYNSTPASLSYGDGITPIRSAVVGLDLPLLRARDIIKAVDLLRDAHPELKEVGGAATDVAGYWLLLAAAVDPRLQSIEMRSTPASIRSAFFSGLAKNVYQVAINGFSKHWDTPDLLRLITPGRRIVWHEPTDWNGNVIPVSGDIYRYEKPEH